MKKLAGFLVAAAAVLVLGACGSGSDASKADKKTAAVTVESIKKAGVLKVGTSADFSPFEFHTKVNGKDEIVGADVDMIKAIAKKWGVDVKFNDTDFDAVLAGLQNGNVDIAVSGISATADRKKTFDFSDNYYNPPQKIVINKKNADKYTSIASLEGKKVGAQKGSIQEGVVKEQLPKSNAVSIAKVPTLINEVKAGTTDALVVEETVGASYIAQNDDLQFADIELKSNPDEAYAIALPKGATELQAAINKELKTMIESGEIEELVQKNIKLANEANK